MSEENDLAKFHFYDVKPSFTVHLHVSGSASRWIEAATKDEAIDKIAEMLEQADETDSVLDLIDLEDVDDVCVTHASANPTRTYLLTRPGRPMITGSTRVSPGDMPRAPTVRDQEMADRFGYATSWSQADVQPDGAPK